MNANRARVLQRLRWNGRSTTYALALALILVANLLRTAATSLPQQLSDETAFLLSSKYFLQWDLIRSLGYVPVPGLVFLKLASYFAAFDDFYVIAKVFNACVLTLAAIPAYSIARRVLPGGQAAVASLLVAITPPTLYGAYFTPEAAYILVFWVFCAVSVAALSSLAESLAGRSERSGSGLMALAAGGIGGIAFLVKPHAAALGIAYMASTVILAGLTVSKAGDSKRRWSATVVGNTMLHIGSFAAGAVLVLLLAGRVIGGAWFAAFDVQVYSTLVAHSAQTDWRFANAGPIATLFALHGAAIITALALPVAAALPRGFRNRIARVVHGKETPSMVTSRHNAVGVFSLATLVVLVLMTVVVTVDFHAIYGGSNVLDRLNGRYYSFALPLLVFVTAGRTNAMRDRALDWIDVVLAAMAAAFVAACIVITQRCVFTFIDAPDLAFLQFGTGTLVAVGAVALLVALSGAQAGGRVAWLIVAGWALMSLLNAWLGGTLQQREDRPRIGDEGVTELQRLFDPGDLDRGIIVSGRNTVAASRAAFRLASRSPVVRTPAEARARIGADTRWVLMLGDRSGTTFALPVVPAGDSTIYRVDATYRPVPPDERPQTYRFDVRASSAPIAHPAYDPETWGIWLTGTSSTVAVPQPLPLRGRLTLRLHVVDPVRQPSLTIEVCGVGHTIAPTADFADYTIEYACERRVDNIGFTGMRPVAPRTLGISNDARELSLALASVHVANL